MELSYKTISFIQRLCGIKSIHIGFQGSDPKQFIHPYIAELTRSQQKKILSEFDPERDSCLMDTILHNHPDWARLMTQDEINNMCM
ncbi:hypothetical protein KC726_05560 [Candidatus Woesebacteria bacterium]|nr:hypothetical protein [Candidatus Woesebacteria bacterium]